MTDLADRLVTVHRSLSAKRIPHAFGGAIALGYWIRDPRGTSDIDVNVFLPAEDSHRALQALPPEIDQFEDTAALIRRDGQVRLHFGSTPVDLFFDYAPVHGEAARHRSTVPFAGVRIPILGPNELAAFKAMFDRTQDWADIEAMLRAETVDVAELRRSLLEMLPEDDWRFERLDEAIARADAERDAPEPRLPRR